MVLLHLICRQEDLPPLFPYSSSKRLALNTIGDHLLYSRIGTNYPVSSHSYFIQSEPTTSMSNIAMEMFNYEIWYFSLSWIFAITKRITSVLSMNGSSWDILHFLFTLLESLSFPPMKHNHFYSSLKYFCWTNFSNNILDSWIMVVVISVAVNSSDVISFLFFLLFFNIFINSITSATILTIFDQDEAWFSRTDKTSVCTTIWFTCTTFF